MSFDHISAAQTCPAGPRGICRGTHAEPCLSEPPLDELLADPLIRVMKQEGVTEPSIRRLVTRLDARRSQQSEGAAP